MKDPYQFMQFLKDWRHDHICNEARTFFEYLSTTVMDAREVRRD